MGKKAKESRRMGTAAAARIVLDSLERAGTPLTESNIRTAAQLFEAKMVEQGVQITDQARGLPVDPAALADMTTADMLNTPEVRAWLSQPPRGW